MEALEAVALRLGVRAEVIETLFNELEFKDSFEYVISVRSADEFWNRVDGLPRRMSMALHMVEIKANVPTFEIQQESVSPVLESFWAANAMSRSETLTSACSQAITGVNTGFVEACVEKRKGWKNVGDGKWKFADQVFSSQNLADMCDSFIVGGRCWLFCDIHALRAAYSACSQHVAGSGKMGSAELRINERLESVWYSSAEEMTKDADSLDVPDFLISDELRDELTWILIQSKDAVKRRGCAPEIAPITESIMARAKALVGQMDLPLQQRGAFNVTSQMLQARSGIPQNDAFDSNSIHELLFTSSNGEPCPMPYIDNKRNLPAASPTAFCRSVFRNFVKEELVSAGYQTSTDSVLDILTDVVAHEIRRMSQAAVSVGATDPKLCIERVFAICGYGID